MMATLLPQLLLASAAILLPQQSGSSVAGPGPAAQAPGDRARIQTGGADAGGQRPSRPSPSRGPSTGLQRARENFTLGDLNRNGGLEPAEAQALGFSAYQARRFDDDGDGRLSFDEFLVGERRRAADQNFRVRRDLEAAVTRILAQRAAQRASERRRQAMQRLPGGRDLDGQGPAAARLSQIKARLSQTQSESSAARGLESVRSSASTDKSAPPATPSNEKRPSSTASKSKARDQ